MSEDEAVETDPSAPDVPRDSHFVGDMDIASLLLTKERCLIRAPLVDEVRSPAGCASVGMLVTLVDLGASSPALATCRPDWTATQDLAIHGAGWLAEGPIVVDSQLVRIGKKVIVAAASVYDGHGLEAFGDIQLAIDNPTPSEAHPGPTLAARALITFARIPGAAAGDDADDYNPAKWVGHILHPGPAKPVVGTMYERMGLRLVDSSTGKMELDLTRYVANSIGTINGGAQATLIEAAAEAMRPGLVATDMQIHYLSQVKTGPARTLGTALRDTADHSVVTVDVVDGGKDDRVLAHATVTLEASLSRQRAEA